MSFFIPSIFDFFYNCAQLFSVSCNKKIYHRVWLYQQKYMVYLIKKTQSVSWANKEPQGEFLVTLVVKHQKRGRQSKEASLDGVLIRNTASGKIRDLRVVIINRCTDEYTEDQVRQLTQKFMRQFSILSLLHLCWIGVEPQN